MSKRTKRKQPIGIDNRLSIIAQALNDFAAEGGDYYLTPGDDKTGIWLNGVTIEERDHGRYLVMAKPGEAGPIVKIEDQDNEQ